MQANGSRATSSWVWSALMLCFVAGGVRGALRKSDEPPRPKASNADVGKTIERLDPDARRKALDGAWIVRSSEARGFSSDYTPMLAISIAGDRAQQWDGRAETSARVQLDGPCAVALMMPTKDKDLAGESGSVYTFLVHDGAAELGIGDAGQRVGDGAVVCADQGVYVLDDDGDCARIDSYDFEKGMRTHDRGVKVSCGFRKDAGAEVFYYDSDPAFADHKQKTLPVEGWRIGGAEKPEPSDPNGGAMHRYDDFAAARAVVDADARANDPLLIAQAAGGKVGDKATVPGLVATFASDDAKLADDEIVRVTGVVVAQNDWLPSEDGAGGIGWLRLAAPDHRDRPTIECQAKGGHGASAIPDGAIIQVAGTVRAGEGDWTKRPFAVPELDDCVVEHTLMP